MCPAAFGLNKGSADKLRESRTWAVLDFIRQRICCLPNRALIPVVTYQFLEYYVCFVSFNLDKSCLVTKPVEFLKGQDIEYLQDTFSLPNSANLEIV